MNVIVLKLIALITMTIDHIGFNYNIDILRFIGRMAFPIYAFLLVNGLKHTHSKTKYLLNIFIFIIISEIPFDLFISSKLIDMSHNSIFITLFIGLLLIILLDYLKSKIKGKDKLNKLVFFSIAFSFIVLFSLLNVVVHGDYGFRGIMLIGLLYLIDDFKDKRILYLILLFISLSILVIDTSTYVKKGVYFSSIFIFFYNDKKVSINKYLKYIFYLYYPIHMFILYLLKV